AHYLRKLLLRPRPEGARRRAQDRRCAHFAHTWQPWPGTLPLVPPSDPPETLYRLYSMRKFDLAYVHLRDLKETVVLMVGPTLSTPAAEDYMDSAENNIDGCVTQLRSAFDAFACAMAHRLGMGSPDL